MQGLGHTLLEEMLYERGQLLNANLVDYRVPRAEDLQGFCDGALSWSIRRGHYGDISLGGLSFVATVAMADESFRTSG